MPNLEALVTGLFEPHFAWGHLPYMLLVVSMLMRDIVWLRVLAIVAGVARIIIRGYIAYDPVAVVWETVLVAINVGQLAVLWWESRNRHLGEDETLLVSTVLPDRPRRLAKRLLDRAQWRELPVGAVLTLQGREVGELLFVADGVARVERDGGLVGICSRGDFVGEMSFVTGGGATATVTAEKPMRVAVFEREMLRGLLAHDAELRHALEGSFNRNLIDKLVKTNAGGLAAA
jgi:hypothetical protein